MRRRRKAASSTTVATRSSSSRLRETWRSLTSWLSWRRTPTATSPLAVARETLQLEELRLAILLVQVELLKAEKERLALTQDVRLLEQATHPLAMAAPQPDPWTEPPPAPPSPDPWTEPPPQEPTQLERTPPEEIDLLLGLRPPTS